MRAAFVLAFAVGCATEPRVEPHSSSENEHDRAEWKHAVAGETHARQVCAPETGACWRARPNPSGPHAQAAREHTEAASAHAIAGSELHLDLERACRGLAMSDRHGSPLEHRADLASVEPLADGAIVMFRPIPGMTAAWLQRLIDCHVAEMASAGHDMRDCPLAPRGMTAKVRPAGDAFAVEIRSDDPAVAADIAARAQRLIASR